ncbi:MAG: maleylpyruvate isomerase family mycothiol-dependent enzyme [Actinomycetales bacterium]
MAPEPERSQEWMLTGTKIFESAMDAATDPLLLGPSRLPGWTGRHVVAHVAANADALRNLAWWAATGVQTPMYASTRQRNDDIEVGAQRPVEHLRRWCTGSADALAADLDALTTQQWQREVRTAQGRSVPATEIRWLRAREVMVHAVDLGSGTTFGDLPSGFLEDLLDDITVKRSATAGHPGVTLQDAATGRRWLVASPQPQDPVLSGPLPDLAAYLAGRDDGAGLHADQAITASLPAWL